MIRLLQRSNDRPQRLPRRHSSEVSSLEHDRFLPLFAGSRKLNPRPASIKALALLGMLHSVKGVPQELRFASMLFRSRCAIRHPGPCLGAFVAESVPDPDLARDGMLQDASALNLDVDGEVAREAHGRCQSKRHIRANCAARRDHLLAKRPGTQGAENLVDSAFCCEFKYND